MVTIDMIKNGVAMYLDENIMSKYPSGGWQKVLAGSVAAVAINNYADKLRDNAAVQAIGLMDNGQVDIDMLAEEVKQRIPPGGMHVSIPMLGDAVFHGADIDDLVETIKGRRLKP